MSVPFMFIRHPAIDASALIQSTQFPYHVYRAYKFDDDIAMGNFVAKYRLKGVHAILDNYRIAICYIGTLSNLKRKPVEGPEINAAVLQEMEEVKRFYEEKRIKGNESRMKRYKTAVD